MDLSTCELDSPIKQFFNGKNLFITGVSGFCGRILLSKILNELTGIGKIYVMMRSKRGSNAKQRVDHLLSSQAFKFNPIPDYQRAKIIPVEGDLSNPELLYEQDDKRRLIETIDIVYHIAASVKFDANFRSQFETNVQGTENVLRFTQQMKQLKVYIHISTAYSNCQIDRIEEKLYPLTDDIDKLIAKIRSVDDKTLEAMRDELFQGRPNSYVYTKAMAEHVVAKHRGDMKTVILRPAIVSPAIRDPVPGYVDSFNGPAGFSTVSSLGIAKVTDWEFNHQLDIFPVDFLANSCLVSAWLTSTNNINELKVYNLCSTTIRPEDNYTMLADGERIMRSCPSLYVIRPPRLPPKTHNMSNLEYKIKIFYSHILFAYFIDLLLFIFRQRPIMKRIVDRMHYALDLMKYFADRHWSFECDNYINLIHSLKGPDCNTFDLDISKPRTDDVLMNVWLGIRRYLLKEDDRTISMARIKYRIQLFLYLIYQIAVLYFAWKLLTAIPFSMAQFNGLLREFTYQCERIEIHFHS
uniref:Fatty acyl-CoA reductase n=1 Tax=Tetranychus urticae TaxID=32264 RepID=T1KXA6_TETUR